MAAKTALEMAGALTGTPGSPMPVGAAVAAPDVPALERAWTACVRESFAEQPAIQGKAGAQRNALDACKDREDAYVAALTEKLPQRRLGTAEEAGAAVVFLMSNGFMNGETLHIDGGARLV